MDFDPNGPGLQNGNFIGLPFDEDSAQLILFPVPWDVTVSYQDGTADGPENILQASTQLDLMHPEQPTAWKEGIFFMPPNTYWSKRNEELRPQAKTYIDFIEQGGAISSNKKMQNSLEAINQSSQNLNNWVMEQTTRLLNKGKLVGLIGGDHSTPLGYLQALAKKHSGFGILHIDAHLDLRNAYEGFTYSHASIFYNALSIPELEKLVSVGIRDYCEAEHQLANEDQRIEVFYNYDNKKALFNGQTWMARCEEIVAALPQKVYISFDIDGLDPSNCPHTGTPVPGGLSFDQAYFLISTLVESGREIIGFDLVEVAGRPQEWDGNVGARLAYHLAVNTLGSQ